MIEAMKSGGYDGAVVLTSFKQTPHPAGYACYLAGIPLRLGESKEWGGGVLTDELPAAPDGLHQAARSLRLVEHAGLRVRDRALGLRVPEEARTSVAVLLEGRGVTPGSPYLLLNPWTSARSRNYPTDRFALAARRVAEETGWPVVVSGTEADRERGRALLGLLGDRGVDLIGSTDLAGLAALVEGARLLDEQYLHHAHRRRPQNPGSGALRRTELEEQWRPRDTPYRLLRRETSCSPCYAFTCPYAQECLDILPGEVAEAGLSLLSEVEVQA